MDIRIHLEIGGSEDSTETKTHRGATRTKYGDAAVLRSTEGVQEMQGEEIWGGGDLDTIII